MSSSFNLPRNPADFRPPTPLAPDGTNPFAEPDQPAASSDNPYGSPAEGDGPAYRPTGYETTIPHRGTLVATLGWLAFGLPILSLVLLAIYALVYGVDEAIPFSPAMILTLAVSIPAWVMSSLDLKAIDAGAMHPEGRRKTVLGGWLGVAGTFLSLLFGLPAIVYAFYWIVLELQKQL